MTVSDITQLTSRHFRILDFTLTGLSQIDIAKKLSMNRVQVGIVQRSPSFQHQLAIRRSAMEEQQTEESSAEIDDVRTKLQENAIHAASKLIDGLSSVDEKIQQKSATEILDRTGYPKEQKVSGDTGNTTQILINTDDYKNLQETLNLDSPSSSKTNSESESTNITGS